ncbi:crossover junction endodeoxyribonuclease RuvC [Peribacillus muralis]|uniref:crossover junction endodeoxyribonuclease RuvC n=1 Tax=Peribacillus muralis TaxID=264697 RepID=UPI00366CAD3D
MNPGELMLGMDLSLSSPAFCVSTVKKGKIQVFHLSHLKTNDKKGFGYRLFEIYNHVINIMEEYPVSVAVKEKGFSRHIATTAKLRGVDGVAALAVYERLNIEEMPEIAPTTIKKIVTGDGKADKEMVFQGVQNFLYRPIEFTKTKSKYDESDALGVCIAYATQKRLLV